MTTEDIERILANVALMMQESAVRQEKFNREADARYKEADARYKEADARYEKLHQESIARQAKTDAQLAKTDAQLAETDRKLQRLSKLMGNHTRNQGEIAESFFYRSLVANPILGDQHFDRVLRNLGGHHSGIQDEFDIVLENGASAVVIEVKGKAHIDDVTKVIERKIPHLRVLFPHYANMRVYGAIASLADYESLQESANQAGIFYLTQQGKHLVVSYDKIIAY